MATISTPVAAEVHTPAFVALETKKEYEPAPAELFGQFGIEKAPTLHPSAEEFADPAKYLRENAELAAKYGIIKIVAPASWKPDFSLDRDTFTFDCRKQDIASLGVLNRTGRDYAERLSQYSMMAGRPLPLTPIIGTRNVPYYSLNHAVQSLGGLAVVDSQNLWSQVAAILGVDLNLAMLVRQQYFVSVFPFENYCRDVKERAAFLFEKSDDSDEESEQDDEESDEENDEEDELESFSINETHYGLFQDKIPESDPEAECMACKSVNTDVCCCKCKEYAHIACVSGLSPGLHGLPRWYCPRCLAESSRFYFDMGKSYTLAAFEKRANAFKKALLKSLNATALPEPATEALLEREFWHIVEGARAKFMVEYGAEIRCEEGGSGFPTKGAYKKDPWNLNNLPYIKDSLFRHLDERISGVTIPWAYVGMTFSAFCWHTEDNFAYSVNYQHLGDPKVWYGIPASHAAEFERLSEWIAPEAFKLSPDLLNDRSSLVSPSLLAAHGIPVYGLRQMPGEFVITCPNAYHAGFNQGFNFNEAVNYIPPDWVPYGFLALEVYRMRRHEPTFCHECVLLRTIREEDNEDILAAVLPFYQKMLRNEIERRGHYRKAAGRNCNERLVTQRALDTAVRSSSYKCFHCKTIPYLSRVYTSSGKYLCVSCASGQSKVTSGVFEVLYSDDALMKFASDAKKRLGHRSSN